MIKDTLNDISALIRPMKRLADPLFTLTLVAIRFFMANIFFQSGLIKLKDILNADFESVVFLFSDIHPIPGVNPTLAAVLGTAGEIIFPLLLAFGVFGRLGAFGLLMMTIVIQFLIPAEYGLANSDHYMWMLLLAVPLFHGMGRLSVDYWLAKSKKA